MAATAWDPKQPRVVSADGGIPPIYKFTEANSMSFKAGSVVDFTGGGVTAVADAETRLGGIAMKDATTVSTGNIEIPVQVWKTGDRVDMLCVTNASSDVEVAASSFSQGQTYAIAVDGNGVCAADLATTHASTEELVFIQPVYDSNGDSTNRGIFVLEGGAANLLSGASA